MALKLGDVRYWMNSGKHVLTLSFSVFDPKRSWANLSIAGLCRYDAVS
jgi:hypothetical protein